MDKSCCGITVTPTGSGVRIEFSEPAGHRACCCCSSEAGPERMGESTCCGSAEEK